MNLIEWGVQKNTLINKIKVIMNYYYYYYANREQYK